MSPEKYGLLPLSATDTGDIEGGFIPLLAMAAIAALWSACNDKSENKNYKVTVNCNNCNVGIRGDSILITPR